ncbi:MAG TPA: cytochrome c [Terriglobales bacterium]|jgi:mono/diheme cytochrome c family protein|nr:cytochrome c [Terriglobales bacterium]
MRGFIAGVIVTLLLLFGVGLVIADLGFLPTHADATPPAFEQKIASSALDASMERHAPRTKNPVPVTDDNLIDGMKIYTMNCAVCHGTMDYKPSALEHSMYPPPPQLLLEPLDDPDWHIYYAVRTGVRYTGMPAWNKALTDQDMWKVTTFLTHLENLSPAAQEYWKKAYGVPPRPGQEHHEHGEHGHGD